MEDYNSKVQWRAVIIRTTDLNIEPLTQTLTKGQSELKPHEAFSFCNLSDPRDTFPSPIGQTISG